MGVQGRALRLACVVGAGVVVLAGCPRSSPVVVDAGAPVAVEDDVVFDVDVADPIAAVVARLPSTSGACAQIKSLKTREEADATATRIREVASLPVSIIEKDLGAKGTWFRLCVGAEDSVARLTASATRWTSGGALTPFLDPPHGSEEPRFHVIVNPATEPRRPTMAQATAVLARSPQGPLFFAGNPTSPVLVATGPLGEGKAGTRVVVVDAAGARLPLDPASPPGCASCAVAEEASPVVSRTVLGVGELLEAAGTEILVDEETASGVRFLAVLTTDGGVLKRAGAVLLAAASTGVILRGEATVVEADGDDDREVAISRLELRTSGSSLCALETRAEIWGTNRARRGAPNPVAETARGLARLELGSIVGGPAGGAAVVDFVTALDAGGDPTAASRACAEVLADTPSSLLTQLCLQRVRGLVADGRLVDAVNAAGALAERSSGLRAAVAGPLFAAMSALDSDPRLSSTPYDCELAPLVTGVPGRSIDETIKLARARLLERLSLVDVNDAVFVTASRDFGADTPVGAIAARWMERLRLGQPARHAAIEAALLPAPEQPELSSPSSPSPSSGDAGPGFGGSP